MPLATANMNRGILWRHSPQSTHQVCFVNIRGRLWQLDCLLWPILGHDCNEPKLFSLFRLNVSILCEVFLKLQTGDIKILRKTKWTDFWGIYFRQKTDSSDPLWQIYLTRTIRSSWCLGGIIIFTFIEILRSLWFDNKIR